MAKSTPPDQHGAVVLLHDGGGDRSQTIAAVDRLIPKLKADGWRFQTVSQAIGASDTASAASIGPRALGLASIATTQFARALGTALLWLLGIVSVLILIRVALVLAFALRHSRRRRLRPYPNVWQPPVTVVVPAYNEEAGIAGTIRSILASTHPVHVIVVDDGSTDRTAAVVHGLGRPEVELIRQPNSGKATALTNGVAAARTDLVVLVDGDTVFEPTTVAELIRPFSDPDVGAVAGNAKVGNRRTLLGQWQHIEYVIGSNLDRRMFDALGCMPTVPGAVGAFRRNAIMDLGGVPAETLAEDTDLTMELLRAGWRVVYAENARAWTEAPATLGQLWKQRYLLLFQVLLPLLAPVVDVAAVYVLMFSPGRAALMWGGLLLMQALIAVVAFRLDREPLRMLWSLPLQQVVYRLLMYLVLVQSMVTAVAGARLPWQKLHRSGHAAADAPVGV
jgi:GT2 family glycosyltransferase